MLSIKAPALATSLVTGGPSLGIGAVGQTVATAAGTGAAAYYTVATAGRAVAAGGRAITGRSGRWIIERHAHGSSRQQHESDLVEHQYDHR